MAQLALASHTHTQDHKQLLQVMSVQFPKGIRKRQM
ncbi:hypothetical protein LINPERPRIM_LOCUS22332 [Linum perenne]